MGAQRVLITGAAGFIGSHLVDRYLQDGYEVLGVDNLITGARGNLKHALGHQCFRFLECDITDTSESVIERAEKALGPCERILHFASPASPVDYSEYPIETMAVNSRGTEFCLKAALRWNARMLFASTSESYGDPLQHPQTETYWGNVNPVGPRSCYDESKRFGEALVMSYYRRHKIDVRIIRIFNTYGPRMRQNDGRVVPNFISQALKGEPLTVFGDGSQSRSFCFVDDLVEGIVRCIGSERTVGEVVNLGNPEEYSIRRFAEVVSEIVGVPLTLVHKPIPTDDPTRRRPDISKARALLGWEPQVSIVEGLTLTVQSFRQPVA